MNPILTSILTSVGMSAASAVAGWAVTKGIVSPTDQVNVANTLLGLAGAGAAAGLGWLKAQKWTQSSVISVVNSPAVPGVKVVAQSSPSATVTEPIVPAAPAGK